MSPDDPKNQNLSKFPHLPTDADRPEGPPQLERSLIAATGVGGAFYFLLPELLGHGHTGTADESSALLAAISAGIFASIKMVRTLCHGAKETTEETALNIAKGSLGGAILGLSIAAVTAAVLVSVIDGGIILGATLAGGAGAQIASKVRKVKRCPHCGEKGRCSHRVCRHCYKIFYPNDVPADCGKIKALDWYQTVSVLQRQGLTFLDAEFLVIEHAGDWGYIEGSRDFFVRCHDFMTWLDTHINEVVLARGYGAKRFIDQEAIERDLERRERDGDST